MSEATQDTTRSSTQLPMEHYCGDAAMMGREMDTIAHIA
jgi:hypothetical protein